MYCFSSSSSPSSLFQYGGHNMCVENPSRKEEEKRTGNVKLHISMHRTFQMS